MTAPAEHPGAAAVLAAMEPSWPPEAERRVGPWLLRIAPGAGKRVGCASAEAPTTAADLAPLAAAAAAAGQPPLVMVRPGEAGLDAMLEAAGWRVVDPVALYLAPVATLATPLAPLDALTVWPPLAIQRALWAAGGIGDARQRVMERVTGPRTAILGRTADRPAGVAFVAAGSGGIAFLHALTVAPELRRQGTAHNILRAAGAWAQDHGARWLGLAVTTANAPACRIYASLGMEVVGHYHYRTP
jgi:GNAT superfamily N-acetyltransferase